jgi:hypothetical protein
MAKLKIVCDDCVAAGGVHVVTMNGPREGLAMAGPGYLGPLGDVYECGGCGRGYSLVLGYFTMRDGISRVRPAPRCHEADFNHSYEQPMYIAAPASLDGPIKFVCPRCGLEELGDLSAIPQDRPHAA